MRTLLLAIACGLLTGVASGDDPPKKLTPEERKELEAKWKELHAAGEKASRAKKTAEAVKAFESALEIARRLYYRLDYPQGHVNLAQTMNDLADQYETGGRLAEAEPLYRGALEQRRVLYKGDRAATVVSLNNLGLLYSAMGQLSDAEPHIRDAVEMLRRITPGDDAFVVTGLNNLASVYQAQGRYADADHHYREALEMALRLFKGDHPVKATAYNNLATVLRDQGKFAEAESSLVAALTILKRMVKGDDPYLATSMNNLAAINMEQGKSAEALKLHRDALDMRTRLYPNAHREVANSMSNVGLLVSRADPVEGEKYFQNALAMRKQLFKGDHQDVAASLNNLGGNSQQLGKYEEAEAHYRQSVEMYTRLARGDHPALLVSMTNLAGVLVARRQHSEAERLFRDALAMERRLNSIYASQKSEAETLTLIASTGQACDGLLSVARGDPAGIYLEIQASKGLVFRVAQRRHLAARAATVDPTLAKRLAAQADARQRRAELLLAPRSQDAATRKKREEDIKSHEKTIADVDREIRLQLPVMGRADRLDRATLPDLQKALPADAALVDYFHYTFFDWDNEKPVGMKESRTPRYLAFVVTRDKVAWVDLDPAAKIEPAITHWREAITGDPLRGIPTASPETTTKLGAKVRELVWDKVRKAIPTSTKVVYICPDADLHRVPFAALPGDKPGAILLEDFALATIPHARFLLDKLWPQDPLKNPPSGVLAIGGVKYDTQLAAVASGNLVSAPLVKSDAKLTWKYLDSAAGEAKGIANLAERKKLSVTRLEAEQATTAAVLAALPKAKHAHFATHGFFADPSFRGLFQLDEKDYERTRRGERIGRAVNSPLVMTGLVFAGANDPKTPGRGIVTGEALVDLDLSGMELAVLSACETGLGDVAGGEGVFGLQRAFHLAGTRNVVASLWKVPDAATAALMGEFYKALWEEYLPPMLALQRAQLAVYKADAKQFETMVLRSPVPGTKNFDNVKVAPPIAANANGKNPPLWWAAFTLSGPGR
jgi:CHAT domain-containing protein/Tfp pilus assembly protein PilF